MAELTRAPSRRTRKRDEQVRRRVRALRAEAHWLDSPAYLPALRRYASLQLLFDSLLADCRERGLFNENGEPRAAIETIRRLSDSLSRIERGLALTPGSGFARRNESDIVVELARRIRDQRAATGSDVAFSPPARAGRN